MLSPIEKLRLSKLAEKPWLAESWEIELIREDPKLRAILESHERRSNKNKAPEIICENKGRDRTQANQQYATPQISYQEPITLPKVNDQQLEATSTVTNTQHDIIPEITNTQHDITPRTSNQQPDPTPKVSNQQPETTPMVSIQQPDTTPEVSNTQPNTTSKIQWTRDKQSKSATVQNSNTDQTCDRCGFVYLPHQLHTCPSCGKQFCDDCYPKHICKKQRVVPPPNTHIALDQQEWYNKQPTPCDNCGKIVRADALRKLDGKKLCPDCILKFANAEQQREKRNTILAICTVVIIIIWVLSHLRG